MKNQSKTTGKAPSQRISEKVAESGDWRGKTLARLRTLIQEADPEVVEERKWEIGRASCRERV